MKFFNALFLVSVLVNACFSLPMTPQEEAASFARMRQALLELGRDRAIADGRAVMQRAKDVSAENERALARFRHRLEIIEQQTAEAQRVQHDPVLHYKALQARSHEIKLANSNLLQYKLDQMDRERKEMALKVLKTALSSFSPTHGAGGKVGLKFSFN